MSLKNFQLMARTFEEAISKKVGDDSYELDGKVGHWRTVGNGDRWFFPDDGSAPIGMPTNMGKESPEKASSLKPIKGPNEKAIAKAEKSRSEFFSTLSTNAKKISDGESPERKKEIATTLEKVSKELSKWDASSFWKNHTAPYQQGLNFLKHQDANKFDNSDGDAERAREQKDFAALFSGEKAKKPSSVSADEKPKESPKKGSVFGSFGSFAINSAPGAENDKIPEKLAKHLGSVKDKGPVAAFFRDLDATAKDYGIDTSTADGIKQAARTYFTQKFPGGTKAEKAKQASKWGKDAVEVAKKLAKEQGIQFESLDPFSDFEEMCG